MAPTSTIRRLTKVLQPLAINLCVATMVLVMAFATVGITFQPCQCSVCLCDQEARSCCCAETPNSGCSCGCKELDDGCSCSFCMCSLGIDVDPDSLPRINDSVTPLVFTTTVSLTSPKPFLTALLRPNRTAVVSQTHLHALHCRWLI